MRQWQKQTLVIAALATISATATAQTPTAPIATAAAPASQPAVPNQQLLTAPELDGLVAPIALYPDALLSLVMMSSTYPLEVVQAERWVAANKLKGDQLKAAVDKQAWDDSIKSLTATPEVLTMMSTKLDWTQKLGDAVLAQQGDVMDAVQRLRARAQSNDKLKSTKEQNVVVRREKEKQVIVIEQTQPDTVYVPYYDPGVVYGAWPYAEYPPYYFPAPGYIAGGLIATGLVFGAGYALGRWATGGWGGGCNWGGNNLVVNPLVGNNWQHNAAHRHGVRYNNASVQQKFGNNNLRASAGDRSEFRGRDDRQGDRGERQGDRQADRGDRQGDRQVDRGDRQGDRQGDRGERQGDRQANRGDRDGARAGQGAKSDRASPAKGKAAAKGGGNRARAQVPKAAARPAARAGGGALNVQSGSMANLQSARGQASLGSGPRGGGGFSAGAGGGRGGGGFSGGGMRGGGFSGGGGRGGGGRRSDVRLKHDIVLLRHLDNGLGLYRFRYGGDKRAYVGVIAQEAMKIAPGSVTRRQDGYLRVRYDRLGVKFQTYEQWINTGDAAAIH